MPPLTNYDRYADIYDLAHTGTVDVPFYVELARESGGPVLELGCGTGRVLLPVARAGVEVWGLDIAQRMLDVARVQATGEPPEVQERIHLQQGDMTSFDLGRRFRLVYIPYRAFLELHAVEDQVRCLECLHRHLEPDGRLALSFFQPDFTMMRDPYFLSGTPSRRIPHADFDDPRTGHRVMAWSSMQFDPVTQVCREVRTYETMDELGHVLQRRNNRIDLRWTFRWEMEHLLARCGFRVEALYGGFDRRPVSADSKELVWVASR